MKLKLGQKVWAENIDGTMGQVTISGRENHNHFEFYKVEEIPGALFLSKSLKR